MLGERIIHSLPTKSIYNMYILLSDTHSKFSGTPPGLWLRQEDLIERCKCLVVHRFQLSENDVLNYNMDTIEIIRRWSGTE